MTTINHPEKEDKNSLTFVHRGGWPPSGGARLCREGEGEGERERECGRPASRCLRGQSNGESLFPALNQEKSFRRWKMFPSKSKENLPTAKCRAKHCRSSAVTVAARLLQSMSGQAWRLGIHYATSHKIRKIRYGVAAYSHF